MAPLSLALSPRIGDGKILGDELRPPPTLPFSSSVLKSAAAAAAAASDPDE